MVKAISRASFQRSSTTHFGTLSAERPIQTASLPTNHSEPHDYRKAAYFQITVGNRAYHRASQIVGRKGIHRRPGLRAILFVSIASAAESFRSTCGSDRGAPECSTQRSPAPTPHVGHGTEDNCSGVSSLFFTGVDCGNTQPQNRSILNTGRIGRYCPESPYLSVGRKS